MIYRRQRRQLLLASTGVFLIVIVTITAHLAPTKIPAFPAAEGIPHTPTNSETVSSESHACPTVPPKHAIIPNAQGRFDWREIQPQYPVDTYAELPTGAVSPLPRIQHAFPEQQSVEAAERNIQRKKAVKASFQRSWTSYKQLAWTKDELTPISGGSRRTLGGWGVTLVDSLDTLWLMDMREQFEEAVTAAVEINFKPKFSDDVNIFETIIRYLGGFLAAYDISGCTDARLLQKAIEVGDMAYASFDTPNRMPIAQWSPQRAVDGMQQLPATSGVLAEMASASVEFTRLSQLTGDMRYFDAISRVSNVLDEQQNRTKLPGMWPVGVNVRVPDVTEGTQFSLGAMADSAYEYLPKMYQLLAGGGDAGAQYRRMYEYAMDTVIQHTLYRPMTEHKADILVTSTFGADGKRGDGAQHLACFAGGMLGLGGRLIQNDTHVDIGRKLTDGCIWTYKHSPLGIMPEVFSMYTCPTRSACDYTGSSPFTKIDDPRYILRPEAIESVFYMYRITGNPAYQDQAWDMFEAIEKNTRTIFGNAGIRNVSEIPPVLEDNMESFWMSETLKYFYLVFSEPGVVSLDEWVFNTEAHPLRIPRL